MTLAASPVAQPPPTPSAPAPSPRFALRIAGQTGPVPVIVFDEVLTLSSVVEASRSEHQAGDSQLADGDVSLVSLDPVDLVLTWVGTACDTGFHVSTGLHSLTIKPTPRPGCDLGRVSRSIHLTYSQPTAAGDIDVVLEKAVLTG